MSNTIEKIMIELEKNGNYKEASYLQLLHQAGIKKHLKKVKKELIHTKDYLGLGGKNKKKDAVKKNIQKMREQKKKIFVKIEQLEKAGGALNKVKIMGLRATVKAINNSIRLDQAKLDNMNV